MDSSDIVIVKRRRNIRKRPVIDDEEDPTVVQRGVQNKTSKTTKTESVFAVPASRTLQSESDQGATRQLETETEFDRDARSRREKKLQAENSSNSYKGLTGYVDYTTGLKKEATVSQEKATGAHGPLRGSTYIRMSARFDYQPDVCKDYKETGFCSFGDSCKFLHDRSDYKSGWELEAEWEEERKKEREALLKLALGEEEDQESEEDNEEESELPFACFICRESWEKTSTPVVTPCKHYFCETCALEQNKKSPKCVVCGQATRGIFNVAHDIVKLMKKRKK